VVEVRTALEATIEAEEGIKEVEMTSTTTEEIEEVTSAKEEITNNGEVIIEEAIKIIVVDTITTVKTVYKMIEKVATKMIDQMAIKTAADTKMKITEEEVLTEVDALIPNKIGVKTPRHLEKNQTKNSNINSKMKEVVVLDNQIIVVETKVDKNNSMIILNLVEISNRLNLKLISTILNLRSKRISANHTEYDNKLTN
jgi:hypothetical protein